jgi:hypothetical protein
MITKLKNPKTPLYKEFKEWVINGPGFTWTKMNTAYEGGPVEGNFEFFSHPFLQRPELNMYSLPVCPNLVELIEIYTQLIEANPDKLTNKSFVLRANANLATPFINKNEDRSFLHYDHDFEHQNIIMYLTDAGGNTYVEGECFEPQEDDIVLFSGEHYMIRPEKKNRVVLILTIFNYDKK